MDKMMAYCGILCSECDAFKATKDNNDELRRATAGQWSKMYGAEINPEMINCLGCRSELLFSHCGECEIRNCAIEKQVDHCGLCDSFPCEITKQIIDNVPGVKERLELG